MCPFVYLLCTVNIIYHTLHTWLPGPGGLWGWVAGGWSGGTHILMQDSGLGLGTLNNNPNLDFIQSNLTILQTDDFINPYTEATIPSHFYDNESFLNKFQNSQFPIIINLNAQSLSSKHFNLKTFILNLKENHVNIKIICLQEIWQIPYPDLVSIPGFSFICKQRCKNRGRGWILHQKWY